MPRLIINGEPREIDVAPDTPLLWALRDSLGLKGTKYGCGVGVCGSCTVLCDGEPLRSCVVPVRDLAERHITTIEGLAAHGHPVLSAWIDRQVPQCGYCQPAQILTAAALLGRHPDPRDGDMDAAMGDVLCRCGTYQRIRQAIHAAAGHRSIDQPMRPASNTVDAGTVLNDWIRIAPDGSVTVVVNHAEMGQGVSTALAMLVAEELEVGLDSVQTEFAPAQTRYRNPMFGEQTTGGSTSVRAEWERLSQAGAQARDRLIQAAARQWQVPVQECGAQDGAVLHWPSGRRLGYGALARDAAGTSAPSKVALKASRDCRLLGRPLPRLDIPAMVAGRTVYGLDVVLPEMRVASITRCPIIGGELAAFDDAAALNVPDVERVVEISSGVAVVASNSWAALCGREALQMTWEPGTRTGLNTEALDDRLRAAVGGGGEVRRRVGDVERVFQQPAHGVEADYATAPLAHGTLEPMNCTARVTRDSCEVWLGTQSPEGARQAAAHASGLPLERVRVHSQHIGGGFGRRLESDMVTDAVELARITGVPVQVLWTRVDDMQHDYYRPPHRTHLRAALDADGWPLAWFQRIAGHALVGEGCAELPYAIPNLCSEFVEVDSPLPAGAWRSVGAGQDAFVVESFIDELALAAGRDPYEYRRALLKDAPRHLGVLDRAAQGAGWGRPAPPGRHRGLAVYRSFGSYVSEVAEVSVDDGQVR
ncbi:MAG TPA: molybdopterin cofactor-binding domain-containing protein, partial [Gammaproteobacteria bacterium]|nr:molybdopterin cofactor-binding domain-containing protein [Gammaproteobacteria bacterium]